MAAETPPNVIHESPYKAEGSQVQIEQLDGRDVVTKLSTPESLQREFDILSRIDDPGIPKLLSGQEDVENGRMTMELMPGKGLDQVIGLTGDWTSTPVGIPLATAITDQLADRLIGVRRGGYLYRDLNPAHALVAQDTEGKIVVSLIDVEAAEPLVDGVATVTTGAGTWETESPEEFDQGGPMTEASNVYSLGVILMQLTTGKNPFHIPRSISAGTETIKARAKFIHEMGLKFFPGEGTPLAGILEKALHPNPAERYQTIREFKRALRTLTTPPGK